MKNIMPINRMDDDSEAGGGRIFAKIAKKQWYCNFTMFLLIFCEYKWLFLYTKLLSNTHLHYIMVINVLDQGVDLFIC